MTSCATCCYVDPDKLAKEDRLERHALFPQIPIGHFCTVAAASAFSTS
jgi:hypothetical protein